MITIIVATDKNNVIGNENDIPWHIPEDFKYFKEQTMNKPIILGRKTWESLPRKPLPNRIHYIISRNENYDVTEYKDVYCFNSLEDAINQAKIEQQEIMIIGGAEIYKQALPFTDKILRTLIDLEVQGDTYFPEIPKEFELTNSIKMLSQDDIKFYFETYERK
jgi:dihydrofolate reductase